MFLKEGRGSPGPGAEVDEGVGADGGGELRGEDGGGEGAGRDALEDGEAEGPAQGQVVLHVGAQERGPPGRLALDGQGQERRAITYPWRECSGCYQDMRISYAMGGGGVVSNDAR